MRCKKNHSAWKHIGHLFPAESWAFSCRTNVSGLSSGRPSTLARQVWLVWRVWCRLFRNGLQRCALGAGWAMTRLQQGKGFTDTFPPCIARPSGPSHWGHLSVGSLAVQGKGSAASVKYFVKKVSIAGQHWSLAENSAKSLDNNLIITRNSYWQTSGVEGLVHF